LCELSGYFIVPAFQKEAIDSKPGIAADIVNIWQLIVGVDEHHAAEEKIAAEKEVTK
jgi:hypothetical protein